MTCNTWARWTQRTAPYTSIPTPSLPCLLTRATSSRGWTDMDEELMLRGLEQFLFDNDWLDNDIVGLTDEDIDTNNYEEITHDTED